MAIWQRRARLAVAVVAIAFAAAVAIAFRPRTPEAPIATPAPTDPNARIEAQGARTVRFNRSRSELRIAYDKVVTYEDGTTRMLGVKAETERAGGRTFTLAADEGRAEEEESRLTVTGNVRLTASDGLELLTDRATYAEQDGVVRAPGPVTFSRGRMRGTGRGMTYDKNRDVVTIHEQVAVRVAPGNDERAPSDINAGLAELNRSDHTIRFEGGVRMVRLAQTIQADAATARLTPAEDRIERLELRGRSHVLGAPGGAGSLDSLSGRDMDLTYGDDGTAIERGVLMGDAAIRVRGPKGSPEGARVITAQHIEVSLTPDGATPTALSARDRVTLLMPEGDAAMRTITARTLEAGGDASRGLTRARFSGDVRFRERGAAADRTARAATLDAALAPGLASFDDATFRGGVRFEEGALVATAAAARYVPAAGTLELTGSEPGVPAPRVVNERLAVDAARIAIVLAGPSLEATGSVRSTLDAGQTRQESAKLPSMLKEGQPVHVTADELSYDGETARVSYAGSARLSQRDTSIRADVLTLDEKTGDLTASGSVATAGVLLEDGPAPDSPPQRVNTIASSRDLKYEEASRRATYTGDAHVSGPQGDMTAPRIELFLSANGDELERVEAHDGVTLREQDRVTTGLRMTYFGADQRYLVVGTPLKVLNECGAETTGRTLTFFKAADRIVIDGVEQRTQTKGGSNCRQ
jgi:LPS export ABC transporter protein LptC